MDKDNRKTVSLYLSQERLGKLEELMEHGRVTRSGVRGGRPYEEVEERSISSIIYEAIDFYYDQAEVTWRDSEDYA